MRRIVIFAFAVITALAHGQTAQPLLQPFQTFLDYNGNPCSGCSLFSYAAGTTTPQATWTNASESATNTNPIILNAAGGATIWMGDNSYKFVLQNTAGTVIWTVDQVLAPFPGGQGPFLPLTGGTLTGFLTAPYYQFTTAANACTAGQYVSGWNASGFICSAVVPAGAAGGDLSGTYPNPVVHQVNSGVVPLTAALVGTNGTGQIIANTGTIANSTSGNAATATALAATPTNCTLGGSAYGIAANGNALCNAGATGKSQSAHKGSASCSPAGSSYASCSDAVSWPVAFADTSYWPVCSLTGAGGGGGSNSLLIYVASWTTTTVTVTIQNNTSGSGTSSPDINCVAVHN
jgi:hypothetical protein